MSTDKKLIRSVFAATTSARGTVPEFPFKSISAKAATVEQERECLELARTRAGQPWALRLPKALKAVFAERATDINLSRQRVLTAHARFLGKAVDASLCGITEKTERRARGQQLRFLVD